MKLTTTLLAVGLMAGGLWAQNPNVIQSVQNNMNAVQQQKTNDSNAALGIKSTSAPASKPAPGAPAKVSSPAASPATSAPVKKAAAPAPAPVKAQAVVPASKASSAPKPTVAVKQASPKAVAVKQVSSKSAAKSTEKVSVKTAVVTSSNATAKPVVQIGAKATVKPANVKSAEKISVATASKEVVKPGEKINDKAALSAVPATPLPAAPADALKVAEAAKPPKPEEKKWAMNGKRDPFFSPVVQQPTGSGCSTGKKCLEIGQINLHGVVKSDGGFIAVVTNNLGKAYFLRENDPVFNGYVVRITGDTVVFQETYTDQLGKPLTREVVKRITTPAV
jgi:Tfp pilus assembly protein PilP